MTHHPNWKALSTVDFSWKRFVREGTSSANQWSKQLQVKSSIESTLTGDEAKKIYDEVVGLRQSMPGPRNTFSPNYKQPSFDRLIPPETQFSAFVSHGIETPGGINLQNASLPTSEVIRCSHISNGGDSTGSRSTTKVASLTLPDTPLLNILMKAAEENKHETISKYIEDGIDMNAVDQFGWTILMCAACSGSVQVVELLIRSGANVHIKDRSGNSCWSLAKGRGHLLIIKLLKSRQSQEKITVKEDKKCDSATGLRDFFCDICKRSFFETSEEKHAASTIHLFNSRPRALGTIYGIPESNKGYQILLKKGWDKESGLGPSGSGHKFPCKTVLKQDRKGLGVEQSRARVTHFRPKEEAAVRHMRLISSGKKSRDRFISREKRKERKLRLELS